MYQKIVKAAQTSLQRLFGEGNMQILEIQYKFYIERKIPSLGGYQIKERTNIHKVINAKVKYDPFMMTRKGTERHNKYNLLKSSYSSFKRGFITKDQFIQKLISSKYLVKYLKRFM